jgi:signal transduction histidine kinase
VSHLGDETQGLTFKIAIRLGHDTSGISRISQVRQDTFFASAILACLEPGHQGHAQLECGCTVLPIRHILTLQPTKRPSTKDLLEMEEMKLHRKLLTVQNQSVPLTILRLILTPRTEILASRKRELEDYESRLRAQKHAFIERDKQYTAREAALAEREAHVAAKEEELRATEDRINQAAQQLRESWDKLKEEQEQFRQYMASAQAEAEENGKSLLVIVTDARTLIV